MFERFLLKLLAKARGSKGGALLIVVGVLVLFAFLVFALVSMAGDIILMITGRGPVIDFLGTGYGVLIGLAVAVVMILLGVAFLNHATPQPNQTVTVNQRVGPTQAERNREVEQLQERLRRAEQERDQLRARLSNPNAERRRQEEALYGRCVAVGNEIRNFLSGYGSLSEDEPHSVQRFRLRHYEKVTELRDQLDKRGRLTTEEYEALTFREDDGVGKIRLMAEVLILIGLGR
jgi:Tfp pilus assembly protein PilX